RMAGLTRPARVAALREQELLLLLFARRFSELIERFEAAPIAIEAHPGLGAGLVRAYCEAGRLGDAAAGLRRREDGPPARDLAAAHQLDQARLVFLAFAGQARAVADLLAAGSPFLPGLPEPVRAYWIATAALYAGEAAPAAAAFERARLLALAEADRRVASLAEAGLRRVATAAPPAEPAPDDLIRQVVARAHLARAVP